MTHTKRETERKYEAPSANDTSWLPDLTSVDGIASVVGKGLDELDAVYYDTDDLRLVGASATLRRRTGGADAGWHLKLPMSGDSREEVQVPLSDTVPDALRDLALSRTRGAELRPVVRIRSTRSTRHLVDSAGAVLAELSLDKVRAESLLATAKRASWTEMEVELAEETDPLLLDLVDDALRRKGIDRASSPSKLSRALEETGTGASRLPDARAETVVPGSAADEVLRYVDGQVHALVDLDPAVRRGLPDSVHRMRVACRRLRSTLRSYRAVLEREVTDPIREELKWLGGELGAERDQEPRWAVSLCQSSSQRRWPSRLRWCCRPPIEPWDTVKPAGEPSGIASRRACVTITVSPCAANRTRSPSCRSTKPRRKSPVRRR
jgi:inorganic triphosphatase YgiF